MGCTNLRNKEAGSESFLLILELSESLGFCFSGWEKSVGSLLIYFLRDLILVSFSHRCAIQPAFPGHDTQLLAGILAAAPRQDYWLHHQV